MAGWGRVGAAGAGGAVGAGAKDLCLEAVVDLLVLQEFVHVHVHKVAHFLVALRLAAQHTLAHALCQRLGHLCGAHRQGTADDGGLRQDFILGGPARVGQVDDGLHHGVQWEAQLALQVAVVGAATLLNGHGC